MARALRGKRMYSRPAGFSRYNQRVASDLLCKTQACVAGHRAARQKAMEEYQKAIKEYEPTINYPGERELYEKFTASLAQYLESSSRGVDLVAAGKAGAADGAHVDSQKIT